jgi:predicted AlkP superfamily phosphohydrolase/phosphomutase
MIALDGGDLKFIRRRLDRLPTMRAALEKGGLIETTMPPGLPGAAWHTFTNACEPGKHGLYQHLIWNPARMSLRKMNPEWCYCEPFWSDLEESGYNVGVVDVPYTFPRGLDRGVVVTDWSTHGQTCPFACSRPDVAKMLQRIGKSPIRRETPVRKTPAQLADIHRRLLRSANLKGDLLTEMVRDLDLDILIAVFAETHRAGHTLFTEADELEASESSDTPLLNVYREVDKQIARILHEVDPDTTTVVLFSVQGMDRDYAQGHLIPGLMRRLNEVFLQKWCGSSPQPPRYPGFISRLRSLVPDKIQHFVGDLAPEFVREFVVEQEIVGGLDWSRTPGFALRTDVRTELRLNLVGREASGFLERGSDLHHRYVEFVRKTFLELRDADTDGLLVSDVVDNHAMFPGPLQDVLPDLTVTWRPVPLALRVQSPTIGAFDLQPTDVRGGDHNDNGFAVVFDGPPGIEIPPLTTTSEFGEFVKNLAGSCLSTELAAATPVTSART